MNNKKCVLVEFLNENHSYAVGYYSWLKNLEDQNKEASTSASTTDTIPAFKDLDKHYGKNFSIDWPVCQDDNETNVPISACTKTMEKTLAKSGVILQGQSVVIRDSGGKFFVLKKCLGFSLGLLTSKF